MGGWAVIVGLRGESGARLAGIGAGLAVTGILGAGLIPTGAPVDLCDAFNMPLRTVVIAGGIGALLIATFADRQPLPRWMLAATFSSTPRAPSRLAFCIGMTRLRLVLSTRPSPLMNMVRARRTEPDSRATSSRRSRSTGSRWAWRSAMAD